MVKSQSLAHTFALGHSIKEGVTGMAPGESTHVIALRSHLLFLSLTITIFVHV